MQLVPSPPLVPPYPPLFKCFLPKFKLPSGRESIVFKGHRRTIQTASRILQPGGLFLQLLSLYTSGAELRVPRKIPDVNTMEETEKWALILKAMRCLALFSKHVPLYLQSHDPQSTVLLSIPQIHLKADRWSRIVLSRFSALSCCDTQLIPMHRCPQPPRKWHNTAPERIQKLAVLTVPAAEQKRQMLFTPRS